MSTNENRTVRTRPSSEDILGGGTLAIDIPETFSRPRNMRSRYYYRLQVSNIGEGRNPLYFVRLRRSESTEDFYLGTLNPVSGHVRMTRASKMKQNSWPVLILNHVLQRIYGNDHTAYESHGFRAVFVSEEDSTQSPEHLYCPACEGTGEWEFEDEDENGETVLKCEVCPVCHGE